MGGIEICYGYSCLGGTGGNVCFNIMICFFYFCLVHVWISRAGYVVVCTLLGMGCIAACFAALCWPFYVVSVR